LLQSLQQQSLNPGLFEVIIVEDGPHTAGKTTSLFNTKFALRLLQFKREEGFEGHSAGLCRNLAAKQAAGKYFVFVDSDCILHPDCLKIHLQLLEEDALRAVCGYACELPATNWHAVLSPCYESYDLIETLSRPDARVDEIGSGVSADWCHWYSCNASVSREVFLAAGAFDETGHRCHDMDLAYRLRGKGAKFIFAESARIAHVEHPRSLISRTEQQKGWQLIAAKHPELESFIFDRMMESQRHQKEIALYCEEQFVRITKDLPGTRSEYSWIAPPGTKMDDLLRGVEDTACLLDEQPWYSMVQLGLQRNCWDYRIFIPKITSDTPPAISVLIPFFNTGEKILKAVSSVFLQTVQNFELILIDDASQDNSAGILLPFLGDHRVRLYTNAENQGLAAAMNIGLTHSSAPIVLHLDSDDWLETDAIEKVLFAFDADREIGAVYGDVFLHYGGGTIVEPGRQINSFEECFSYDSSQAPRAYRKESLISVGGWDVSDGNSGRFYEDRLTLANIIRKYPVKWLGARLYHCRFDNESLSRIDPILTASAKLSILHDQANKNGLSLRYTFKNNYLRGELISPEMSTSPYSWSVIIPFSGHSDLLYLSVLSWMESDLLSTEFEIIIVDDASNENLNRIVDLAPGKIRVVSNSDRSGPATARNRGAACASHEMIFFSDSDHIVPPDVLAKHSKRISEPGTVIVGNIFGRRTATVVLPGIQKRQREKILSILNFKDRFGEIASVFATGAGCRLVDENSPLPVWQRAQEFSFTDFWLAKWGELILRFGENLSNFAHRWTRISTGSMSIRAADFRKVGGFDEALKSMEDWEFGIRVQKSNMSIVCCPEAEPFHQVHPVDEKRAGDNKTAVEYITSKHPDYVKNLLNEEPYFAPPAQFFFTPAAHREPAAVPGNKEAFSNACLLTFDDGPHPIGTPMIAGKLDEWNVKALFFLIGQQVKSYPHLVKMLVDKGHEVGIHSWTHTDSCMFTSYEVKKMLADTARLISDVTGKAVKYARPPYGKLSPSYNQACNELGLTPVGWDTSSEDWAGNSANEIITALASQGIVDKTILFHDVSRSLESTGEALDWLLNTCRAKDIAVVLPGEFVLQRNLSTLEICNPFK
jgi:glycosyltransferase involved in cell wall biosynthesis/peptidoglycan/xylan/chitin deacetylase (PgdA/CDA1 family)